MLSFANTVFCGRNVVTGCNRGYLVFCGIRPDGALDKEPGAGTPIFSNNSRNGVSSKGTAVAGATSPPKTTESSNTNAPSRANERLLNFPNPVRFTLSTGSRFVHPVPLQSAFQAEQFDGRFAILELLADTGFLGFACACILERFFPVFPGND